MLRKLGGLSALALSAVIGVSQARAAETFPLVDGAKQAIIVGEALVKGGGYRGPENFLQHYIAQSTGRTLKSVTEKEYDPAAMPFPIFVGKTAKALELFDEQLKKLDSESYIVSVTGSYVVLVGTTDESTRWAQFDFAREYLGIDSYFLNKLGLIVPKHATVSIPAQTRVETPAYKNRSLWALNADGPVQSKGWCMGDIPWRTPMYQRWAVAEQNIQKMITVKEYGETHPEYFPFYPLEGKRRLVDGGSDRSPCISNPEVVKIIIDKTRKYLDEHPNERTCCLGMADGGYCECPQCKALDGPALVVEGCQRGEKVSRRWFTLVNQVAVAVRESHPGKIVVTLGYAGCEVPPADLKLEPNILPFICWSHSCWFNPEVRKANLAVTDAWLSRLDQIGLAEYYYGSSLAIPMIYTHDMADYLRHVRNNARSKDTLAFFAEVAASWGLDGPKVWILEKLLWNPEQDVDQLTKRWCDAVFEEASPAMIRYFQELERMRVKNGPKLDNITQYVPWKGKAEKIDLQDIFGLWQKSCQMRLFPPEDVTYCQGILEQARQMAKQDIVKERIEFFASTFKLTEYASKTYHAYYKLSEQLWNGDSPDKLLATLVEGDAVASPVDALEYAQQLTATDKTKFCGPTIHIEGCGLAVRKIVLDTAGKRIKELLTSGTLDQEKLAAEGRKALAAIAPATATEFGKKRMETLNAIASRVATAHRVATPPKIDGNPDEALWQWVDQHPWFKWQSTVVDDTTTKFAFAYDDQYLYLALRCPQKGLATQERCPNKFGASAWLYPSVEFFMNKDQPGVTQEELAFYQAIPAFGGGFLEHGGGLIGAKNQATTEYAITDNADEWRAELKIDLKKLGLAPAENPWLRINLARNLGVGGFSSLSWFPSPAAHKDGESRGWLVFGK